MTTLDINSITRLHKLFTDKGWVNNFGQDIIFGKFCSLLSHMDLEERELMIELTERYEWITYNRYGALVHELFKDLKVESDHLPRKIYLFPAKKPQDGKKIKSADSLLYLLSGFIHLLPEPYNRVSYIPKENYDEINEETFKLQKDELFFIIDDFIGSGQTIKTVIEEVQKNKSISRTQIKVLSLVAHEDAIALLKGLYIDYSVSLTHGKGISDYYQEPVKSRKIDTMRKIETRVTTNKRLQFGFSQSEGLITLIRTPNNTFPIFWMDYSSGTEKIPSPFPRFQTEKP